MSHVCFVSEPLFAGDGIILTLLFGFVWSAMLCFCYKRANYRDLFLKFDSERLQTSMPGEGFEPTDYSIKWQLPTIRPSPGKISCFMPYENF